MEPELEATRQERDAAAAAAQDLRASLEEAQQRLQSFQAEVCPECINLS